MTPLARTSCRIHRRRYLHVDGRRLLAGLGSVACSGLRRRRRLPTQGPRCRSPSRSGAAATDLGTAATTQDRGTFATARRGNGVAATGLGTAATAQGHCRRSPSRSGAAAADLGTAASTSDRGTAATGRGSTAARAIGQPQSLMNRDEA
jgi:hypothetical protein